MIRVVLRGGAEERVRSYLVDGERVALRRPDGSSSEVPLADVDLAATFAANAAGEADSSSACDLELLVRRDEERGVYRLVEGSVRNVSGEPLIGLVARVLTADREGNATTCEEALVDPSPLSPGACGTFRVVLRAVAPGAGTTLAFRRLQGAAVEHRPAAAAEAGLNPPA